MGFRAIRTAGPLSFFSAWLTMICWGIVAPELRIKTIGYPMAMLADILAAMAVWLVVAPLAAATMRSGSKWHCWGCWQKGTRGRILQQVGLGGF
ncbi:MAG: hypothetical protein A2Y91_08250 [Chloroflexi bacterium RBG_13_54_8]|nr:MAG: hypothetical protein A2Y91_08250 [Chloroflexi bacterium RBG_13_54_8]